MYPENSIGCYFKAVSIFQVLYVESVFSLTKQNEGELIMSRRERWVIATVSLIDRGMRDPKAGG